MTLSYKNLVDVMIESNILEKGNTIDDININNKKHKKFYLKHADSIFRTSATMPEEQKEISRQNPNKIIPYKDTNGNEQYALNGNRMSFLDKSLKPVFIGASLENDIANLLCDFWSDIDFNNTQNQGGVSFTSAKKPEQLLYRIIEMTTQENDLVMDFFAGSGTTLAVAHKMKRRYIGIEQMEYIESITKKRLEKVIDGESGGISKAVGWEGGGSFIYAELMPFNAVYKEKILSLRGETKTTHADSPRHTDSLRHTERSEVSKNIDVSLNAQYDNTPRHTDLERSEREVSNNKDVSLNAQHDVDSVDVSATSQHDENKSARNDNSSRIDEINKELEKIYNDLESKAFLDYRVDFKEFLKQKDAKEFKDLSLENKKKLLISMLDSNMDYVPLSDINDSTYDIESSVKEINKIFYKK